ncbi:methionine ABC transporter ATP-binding protein [Paenibacillus alvei TS-15]|uniref:Methionine ABC transporter ATP-binding protein n=2 Tax=Paenibacillus TaxID=44249 RepID=S9U1C8_PAEAL|nr:MULTISPECIES: methionine ABC transporter ATP-binding protein [Paenibacillus]EPY08321.1 methionine ABC transporter ATP-binding protein [Paenibacillus alvei TS-15]OBY80820.1 methionine ABC transporter ATP-binding protein [Paenibacillus sp. KS1]TQR42203.1 methionine ABC transporter ATP-binding protein [Paenibacillus sp. SDF0028]SDF97042.1 D-methionine transport system ATP-binding protein [Paenibacillus sp. cl6col]
MIRLEHISKQYGANGKVQGLLALDDVSLSVESGEIYGIIGHSGAGKSTLLRSINLLERPTAGVVEVDGVNLTKLSKSALQQQRRKIGMIFQHFNLLSSATVYDNIAFPMRLAGTSKDKVEKKVNELIRLVGLEEHKHKYPAQLSGGQKQRVGIARALANDPKVLLCDEATSALDPQTTNAILELLLDINRKFGITIVLITHEMHVIQAICDKVAVIHGGKIAEAGKVVDVFLKPQHPVTREFILEERSDADIQPWAAFKSQAAEHSRVVKINYLGDVTYEPVLHRVLTEAGVSFAILQGTISRMKDTPYGQLVVRLDGDTSAVEQSLSSLRAQGLEVEVIA